MTAVRGWSAGTTRRFGLLLALSVVASLVMLQQLAVRAGVAPEASWRPALAGTVAVLAAAVAGHLLTGRSRRHTPVPASLCPALKRLTESAGLSRPPVFAVDPRALSTGAVTLGRTRRYRVVLDAGLICRAARTPARFDAVVLHELAHVRNRDVEVAQLAVALWRVTTVAVLLPYAFLDPGPAVLVSAVLYLMYAEVLRKRELYADRDAVTWGADPAQWAAPVRPGVLTVATTLLRTHPTPGQRRRALGDPESRAAAGMVGESFFAMALTMAAFVVALQLLNRPELLPGARMEWPGWLKAGVAYPAAVAGLAAFLVGPSRRYGNASVVYVPMDARHRRSAAIRLGVLFTALAALLFATDPVHLLSDDWPKRLNTAPVHPAGPFTAWTTARSPALAARNRAWLAGGGNAAIGGLVHELVAVQQKVEATPPRRIDWYAFAPHCAALDRVLVAVDALGAFPDDDGRPAWTALRGEARAGRDVLCGHHHYTRREFGPLVTAAGHLRRAEVAGSTVYEVLFHYMVR